MHRDTRKSSTLLHALIPQHGLVPLEDLSVARLQRLIDESAVLDFGPGQYVFRQGDRDLYVFYLLRGELELYSDGELVSKLQGGTEEARFALAQLQPRQLSALPKTLVRMLRVERARLDHYLAGGADERDAEPGDGVAELGSQEDWITRLLQSPLFARLPVANIQRLFAAMEAVEVEAGQSVIEQGQVADSCYVIKEGLCEVQRSLSQGEQRYKLAQLGPGERFGEEGLITGGVRNATVRALTNCALMRLDKASFHELVIGPAVRSVTLDEARDRLSAGARWLDVRYPDEQAGPALPDSLDLPLNVLRSRAHSIDKGRCYIACCDNGTRSAVAAFLLTDAGCDCAYLAGGLEAHPDLLCPDPAVTGTATAGGPDESNDPEVQAAVLKARLAQARLELHEALRVKQEAERAHAAEQAADLEAKLDARSRAELARAQALSAEAEAMRRDLEEARRRAEAEARRQQREAEARAAGLEAEHRRRSREHDEELLSIRAMKEEELAAIERLRADAEAEVRAERERLVAEAREVESRLAAAHRHQQEVERAARDSEQIGDEQLRGERERAQAEMERANALVAEAEAMKRELEEAKRQAEADALQKRREEEERLKGLEAFLETRLREREQGIEALAAQTAEELEHARMLREESERQARAERERLEQEAREVEARVQEARCQQEAIEREIRETQGKKQAELQHREARVAADIERANAVVAHAEAMKRDIEKAKLAAEQEAMKQRQVEAERIRGLKAKLDRKLRSRERELEETAKKQSEELTRIEQLKERAAAELAEERKRFAREALEAKKRLSKAEHAEREIEASRTRMAEEVDRKHQDLLALEKSLRADIDNRLAEDRARLEAELARAAGELAAAEREREAAEAARHAAAAEAERKIAEYRTAFERLYAEERAKLQAEKQRLAGEAKRIQGVVEEARRQKREAERARLAAEDEVSRLRGAGAPDSQEGRDRVDHRIQLLEQEMARAQAQESAAARAQGIAEGAQQTAEADLLRQREAERRLRAEIDAEVAEWRREQEAFEQTPDQLELTARLDHQVVVAKKLAKAVRRATAAHDDALVKELSVLAQGG